MAFVCIIVCIQECCYLPICDQLLSTQFEGEMMWLYHIPVLLASNLRYLDHFTSFWSIWLGLLTFPYPAPSHQFLRRTIRNFEYLNNVHEVCAEIYAAGAMDECGMTVVVQTDSSSALTAHSMTWMTSFTYISLIYFVTNIAFVLLLNSHLQIAIDRVGRVSAWFGF